MAAWLGMGKSNLWRVGVLTTAVLLAGCGDNRTEAEYLTSAETYLNEGQAAAAIIEYKNALKLNPKNANIRLALGLAYLSEGNAQGAEKELKRALELGADRNDVLIPLAKVLNQTAKIDELLELTRDLSEVPADKRLFLHIFRGQALINQNKPEDARLEFELANEMDPRAPFGQLGDAYLKTLDNQMSAALGSLDALLKEQPDFVEALLLKGRLLLADGQSQAAADIFTQLVQVEPNIMGYRLLQSEALIAAKQFDQATEVLTKIRKVLPNHPVPVYYQAVIAFEGKDCKTALERTSEVLQALPEHFNSRMIAGYCHFLDGNNEQAYQLLSAIAPLTPANHLARKTLAITQFRLGYHEQAADTLRGLEIDDEKGAALLSQLGDEFMKSGEHAQAKELFERALGNSSDPANMLRLGMAKLSMDDTGGLADLEAVLNENPEMKSAKLLLALNLIKRERKAEALEVAQKWVQEEPESIDAANLLATVYRSMSEFDKATAELDRALLLEGDKRNTYYQAALIAAEQKDVLKARDMYQRLLVDAPLNLRLLREWFLVERAGGDPTLVGKYLDESIAANPELTQGPLVKAQFLLSQDKTDQALALLDGYAPDSPYYADAVMTKGRMLTRASKLDETLALYQQWLEEKPDDFRAALFVAETYEYQQQFDKAINVTRGAMTKSPNEPLLGMMMANLQLKAGKIAVAEQEIASLKADGLDTPYLTELEGRLAMHQGQWVTAIRLLGNVQREHPSTQRALYLGHAYVRSGNSEQGQSHLEAWLKEHDKDQGPRSLLAQIYLAKDQNKAIAQYRILVEQNPANVIALNNLAWLLSEQGQLEEAESFARQALAQAQNNPMVQDTLGSVLLAQGKNAEAVELLAKAATTASNDLGIQFNYAKALAANKQNPDAEKVLDNLLAKPAAAQFAQREDALALLDKVRGKG
ncbi:PEP-CTERM system TPR-repeat protein PrsT [Corallincola luteus]|uniref:PEP-CTERM system TPR-repeat protein PrsT n=1 Tax=Corallincola luteus TaxID=1775177 RepID=A0ABY2ANF5_9GAMM|nr:XrtA/PEP-CTERM system TPR-repeat protein PrsT [Corallincola luteus]TCI04426.1 PEP-CTERM system TPR-repeat protein PrsT [Corallincola luteus]